jgi:hypothetical protein
MRTPGSLALVCLLAALCACLVGCGSSFPHDSGRIVWSHQSGVAPLSHDLTPGADQAPVAYQSPIIASTLGVEQLAVSWNADVPDGAGMWVQVRVRADPDASWSPWLLLGGAGDVACPDPVVKTSSGLNVEVDILTSKTWFRQAQVRVSAAGRGTVRLHRLDIVRSLAFSRAAAGLRRERLSDVRHAGTDSTFPRSH